MNRNGDNNTTPCLLHFFTMATISSPSLIYLSVVIILCISHKWLAFTFTTSALIGQKLILGIRVSAALLSPPMASTLVTADM
jgi:hypothetical protein